MKKYLKQGTAMLLAVILALGLLPAFALAVDNEPVLTSIDHTSAISAVNLSGTQRDVTLTVPYGYVGGAVDLSSGLDIGYSTSTYSNVVPSFAAGSEAAVDGAAVSMTVTYQKVGDTENTFTTVYNISVKKEPKKDPKYSGTLSKSLVAPGSVTFKAADFTGLYEKNDGDDLTYISIDGSNPSYGGLQLDGSPYDLGSLIAVSSLGKLSFVCAEAPDAGKTVAYTLTAYTGPEPGVKVENGSAILSISIGVITVPTITKAVAKSVNSGSTVSFALRDFSDCYNLNNGSLQTITVTPTDTNGTWYNGSTIITKATSFTGSTIGNLKYKGSVSGNGSFKWTVTNEAGISAEGSGTVTVSVSVADVTYTVGKGVTAVFEDSDFNTVCKNAGLGTLDYIVISGVPSTTAGALYTNYTSDSSKGTKLSSTSIKDVKFYRSSLKTPYLDKVAFVPSSSYTGSFTLSYTGYDVNGQSFPGTIKITVRTLTADTIEYETFENETVVFTGSDFNTICKDLGLKNLDYIQFTATPLASRGTIYYNYASESSLGTKISTNTKLYYRSGNTYDLNAVAFKPYKNYYGTVNLSYMGYDLDGVQFSGTVSVVIEEDNSDVDPVVYTTPVNKTFKLSGDDFNDVCEDEGYEELYYISLDSLPNSDRGVFYYNYSSASSLGTRVSTSTKLYYDSNDKNDLDKVAFVPAKDYEGSFIVSYTGVDVDGDRFDGQIKITVSEGEAKVSNVTYVTQTSTPLTFVVDDFNKVCKNETGYSLSYIQFTLPGSSYGKLYRDYNSSTGKGTSVTSSTKFYRSSTPRIDTVSFVAASGYSGVVTINYTGEDTDGTIITGSVAITVVKDSGAYSKYFDDVGSSHSWASKQIDYLYEEGVVTGTGGKKFNPGANIIRGDFVLMLHRSVKFTKTSSGNFSDVPKSSYYYDAIAAARASGIAQGDNGNFYPTKTLTRQDAMVLVYRALDNAGYGLSTGTSSNLSAFSDRGSISSYATTAVATLVKAGVVEGSGGKINPLGSITRAEMSVILYRVLNLD